MEFEKDKMYIVNIFTTKTNEREHENDFGVFWTLKPQEIIDFYFKELDFLEEGFATIKKVKSE